MIQKMCTPYYLTNFRIHKIALEKILFSILKIVTFWFDEFQSYGPKIIQDRDLFLAIFILECLQLLHL
jgi:hypothetical protein